ncbi:uncharacterized protein LOC143226330 isoform X2 [Tachypleus tridentatus]|uniref:uncharacterized protein LOC143226330 isoform X2 n=1 Tax=Tachypleus tridentatus TaxID=6853 RepID=UPI003FD101C9
MRRGFEPATLRLRVECHNHLVMPSRIFYRRLLNKRRFKKKSKKSTIKQLWQHFHDVFLGGSCNPTRWRANIAIPLLENCGITYYNPQRKDWRPELLQQENVAKQMSKILLFVVDNQTRSVATMIETAYLAGTCAKNLFLVIQNLDDTQSILHKEVISNDERLELKEAHELLKYLVQKQNIPVFATVEKAVPEIKNFVKRSCHSLRRKGLSNQPNIKITSQLADKTQKWCSSLNSSSASSIHMCFERKICNEQNYTTTSIERKGITCSKPSNKLVQKVEAIEKCKHPVFIIGENCRGLSHLILASYLIGRGQSVVLHVQNLKHGVVIGGEELSQEAIKDYNRGRAYLMDLAKRSQLTKVRNFGSYSVELCNR